MNYWNHFRHNNLTTHTFVSGIDTQLFTYSHPSSGFSWRKWQEIPSSRHFPSCLTCPLSLVTSYSILKKNSFPLQKCVSDSPSTNLSPSTFFLISLLLPSVNSLCLMSTSLRQTHLRSCEGSTTLPSYLNVPSMWDLIYIFHLYEMEPISYRPIQNLHPITPQTKGNVYLWSFLMREVRRHIPSVWLVQKQ